MNCKEYDSLSHHEKVKLIGCLVHSVQNSSICFQAAHEIIELAEQTGVLKNVVIAPEQNPNVDKGDESLHGSNEIPKRNS